MRAGEQMTESIRETGSGTGFAIGVRLVPQPARWRTFLGSVGLHLLAVLTMLAIDRTSARAPYPPASVAEAIASENLEITWYRPADLLPAVAPAAEAAQPVRPDAPSRFKLKQRIEASSPAADSLRQTIVNGPPEIVIEQDIETANMLALAPGAELRYQRFELGNAPRQAREAVALLSLDAPRIDVRGAYDELAAMRKLERMRYLPAQEKKLEPKRQALEAGQAPDVAPAALGVIAPLRYELGETTGVQEGGRPGRQAVGGSAAPHVTAEAAPGIDLGPFQRIQRLRYAGSAPQSPAAPVRGALGAASEAPHVPDAAAAGIDTALFQHISPLRYASGGGAEDGGGGRTAAAREALGAAGGVPAAPELRAGLPFAQAGGALGAGADSSGFQRIAKLRFEQWGAAGGGQAPDRRAIGTVGAADAPPQALAGLPAPAAGSAPPGIGRTPLAGGGLPPPPAGGGGTAERALAAVGANPGERIPQEIPRGQRRGSFSAGPDPGEGAGGGGTQTAKLHVPHLTIGGRPQTEAAIAAVPAGGAAAQLRRLADFPGASSLPTLRAAAAAVDRKPDEIDPDRPFRNRPSYSLAINMPNITSSSGSWELQFAEIGGETEVGKLAAPVPRVKVDPRYVREAIEEDIEGEVVLHGVIQRDGVMDKLRVIRGIDDRLDASALSALSKWRFDPAQKYGRPVAVEAVVRIPFQIAPADARR